MINYVWIGLLLLAIGYGAYLDVTKHPTSVTPAPMVVNTFDKPFGDLKSIERKNEDLALELPYSFGEGRRAEANLGLEIPKEAAGTKLTVDLRAESAELVIQGVFANAAGDQFVTAGSTKLEKGAEWATITFDLASLTPVADNPLAKPSFPLTLAQLAVVRPAGSDQPNGALVVDNPTLVFPAKSLVGSEVAASNWMGVLTKSVTRWAELAIKLAIELIGIIMFWLGLMRIAEQAGLVRLLARSLRPIMKFMFPQIPPDGEAMGAIVMNVAANMLGLGNAATPLGLKAMEELQKLNQHKEYASDAQCMLLAINTSSVTIIAPTIIGYRAAAGSTDLMKFWPVMIGATLISTFFAVLGCKILERLPIYRIPLPPQMRDGEPTAEATA